MNCVKCGERISYPQSEGNIKYMECNKCLGVEPKAPTEQVKDAYDVRRVEYVLFIPKEATTAPYLLRRTYVEDMNHRNSGVYCPYDTQSEVPACCGLWCAQCELKERGRLPNGETAFVVKMWCCKRELTARVVHEQDLKNSQGASQVKPGLAK